MRDKEEPRLVSMSYLRAFVTLLVVAHHASLAYTTFNKMPRMPSFTAQPFLWAAFPVVDRGRWPGFDVFVGWNDIFFMALMFFVSGLFVWPSLRPEASARPILLYLALAALSLAAYLPLEQLFGPFQWSSSGPFAFQSSRILHYFVYFCAGVCAGALGTHVGLFDPAGRLGRRWYLWGGLAIFAFADVAVATISAKPLAAVVFFPLSCAASSLFLIAVFVRFSVKSRVADSLSNNAYGIYLLHYLFVIWLQWALLPAGLPAVLKGFVVFAGATGLSWLTAALVRRNRAVAQIV